ncbi:MAG TPA: tetratricopeptide repeat protein, partial [bacterium]|nr:tetratricopeptide repeat protein [bacterium]
KKALDISLKMRGSEHLEVAVSYFNLGLVYAKKRNFYLVKDYFEKAYNIFYKTVGEYHPYTMKAKEVLDILNK